MLKVIHPRYAVQVMDKFIPDELLAEFVKEINYEERRLQVDDGKIFSTEASPLTYKLLSIGHTFLSKFNIRSMAVEYFIWRRGNPIFLPHIDVDNDPDLTPIAIRLNIPVYSYSSTMDWFEVREDSVWKENVRKGLDGNHDTLQITEDAIPDYSVSADHAMFVNPAIPHRIDMKSTNSDRLTLSYKIKNKFSFEDFVKQIPEQYLSS